MTRIRGPLHVAVARRARARRSLLVYTVSVVGVHRPRPVTVLCERLAVSLCVRHRADTIRSRETGRLTSRAVFNIAYQVSLPLGSSRSNDLYVRTYVRTCE